MTTKSTKQTKQQTSSSTKRPFWKKHQEPNRSALKSFARVGLLGLQMM